MASTVYLRLWICNFLTIFLFLVSENLKNKNKNISVAGTEGPGVSISEERQSLAENSATTVVYNPYAALSIEQQRQKLPVFKVLWISMFSRRPEAACSSLILGTEVNNVPLTVNGPLECSELGDGLSEGCLQNTCVLILEIWKVLKVFSIRSHIGKTGRNKVTSFFSPLCF